MQEVFSQSDWFSETVLKKKIFGIILITRTYKTKILKSPDTFIYFQYLGKRKKLK